MHRRRTFWIGEVLDIMNPFRTFEDAYSYIARSTNYERMTDYRYTRAVLDLDRVRRVLDELGAPDRRLKIVHIAGTKGKGSVALMTASILEEAGYRVGAFTKPHLLRLNERVAVDGQPIPDADFVAVMNRLHPHLEARRRAGDALTFFDLITVLALTYFAERQVDFAVVEVGLGGRLDSTNVVSPEVTAITSIGLDHTDKLGDTLERIAAEKAGILKAGVPVVVGVPPDQTGPSQVIRGKAQAEDAPLYQIERDFRAVELDGPSAPFAVETWRRRYEGLRAPAPGAHQRRNAAVAVALIEVLQDRRSAWASAAQVREGLQRAHLPGRIEVLRHRPTVILDVAHNPSSMAALRRVLEGDFRFRGRRVVLLLGMAQDKECAPSLAEILSCPCVGAAVFTTNASPRSARPEELAEIAGALGFQGAIVLEPDTEKAFGRAWALLEGPDDVLCITGSFYLAGAVAALLKAQ